MNPSDWGLCLHGEGMVRGVWYGWVRGWWRGSGEVDFDVLFVDVRVLAFVVFQGFLRCFVYLDIKGDVALGRFVIYLMEKVWNRPRQRAVVRWGPKGHICLSWCCCCRIAMGIMCV